MGNPALQHVPDRAQANRLHWLIVSDANSSLIDMALGRPVGQGTPVPARFVEFLCNLNEQVTLVLPIAEIPERALVPSRHNLRLIPVPVRKGLRRVAAVRSIYKALAPIVKNERPDVIYASGYDAISCAFFARVWKIPCFTRMYGTFLTQLLNHPWRHLRNVPKLLAEAMVLKLAKNGVIVTNDGTQGDQVCTRLRVRPDRLFFEPNGIDRDELRAISSGTSLEHVRRRYQVPKDAFLISSVSRLASWKRVDLVLEAVNRLETVRAGLPREVHLLIAGDGSAELRRSLQDLASRSWMSGRIQFLGNLPRQDVLQLLAVSDVTTSFYEVTNVGNVLLEAMQLGTVVAARGNGDTDRFVIDNLTGFVLPENPQRLVAQFVRLVSRLQNDPTLTGRIGRGAARWADVHLLDWRQRFWLEYNWILKRAALRSSQVELSLNAA